MHILDTVAGRYALCCELGMPAFIRQLDRHFRRDAIARVGDVMIYGQITVFGPIFQVGDKGPVFSTFDKARRHALSTSCNRDAA